MTRRLTDWWINNPRADLLIVTAAIVIALAIDPHDALRSGQQADWYQTLATVNGILLSLGTIAITLIFTVTPSDRLKRAYTVVGRRLEHLLMSCLGALVLTTTGFAALYLTNSTGHGFRVGLTAGLIALSALRFARLWWLLRRILQALMTGLAEPTLEPWERPSVGPHDYSISRRPVVPETKD